LWTAERQFRFGRQTAAFDEFAEFCPVRARRTDGKVDFDNCSPNH
jgi:hypothetical protein